jgi:hypothetical protein
VLQLNGHTVTTLADLRRHFTPPAPRAGEKQVRPQNHFSLLLTCDCPAFGFLVCFVSL